MTMLERGRHSDVIYNDNDACRCAQPVSFLITTVGSFPGGKTSGTDGSSQSNAKIECVELYLHSPYVFIAWCLIKHRATFILILPVSHIQVVALQKLFVPQFCTHSSYMSSPS
jgi:hypothetical protein